MKTLVKKLNKKLQPSTFSIDYKINKLFEGEDKDIIFSDSQKGVILVDRSNSKKYRLYIDDGKLGLEEVI